MRWLALALVLLFASDAYAKRVVRMPTLRELCPGTEDWGKTAACLARQGTHKLLRDEPTAKLVDFELAGGSRLTGVYLYVLKGKRWMVQGELRMYEPHELVDFSRVTYGKHAAYRIDLGVTQPSAFILDDGESTIPATMRFKRTLVCPLAQSYCVVAMTSCDLMVRGKAYHSFRGALVYQAGALKVVGDRRNTGIYCQQNEVVTLLD